MSATVQRDNRFYFKPSVGVRIVSPMDSETRTFLLNSFTLSDRSEEWARIKAPRSTATCLNTPINHPVFVYLMLLGHEHDTKKKKKKAIVTVCKE